MADELEGARTKPVRFRDMGDGTVAEVIEQAVRTVPVGYEQIGGIVGPTVKALSGMPGARYAIVTAKMAGRYRDDGPDPTAAVGMPFPAATPWKFDEADLTDVKFVTVDTLDVTYYA